MHRIDTPDATRDGRFTEGDPSVPVPATTVSADWLNAVQEEVIAVMTEAGLAPAKNDNAQLLAALKKVVGTVNALTATRLETARHIDGVSFNGTADIHHHATCATASGTAAKTAALAGFRLQTGAALRVKFANANTAANATLNVGGTGAKPLYYHGKAVPAGLLAAGHTYAVVYNGTQYEIIGDVLVLESGGGLAFDAKGHLFVDFSLVPPEQMRAIVLSMMQQGGGLNVDGKGKLYVDFASMPTDKFESMLKSIRVPVWLTGNKSFYVNINTGSDALDDGRGESAGKPFKTLQACLNYVCDNFNISRHVCTINVAPGTYSYFSIADFARTTGYIMIVGESAETTIVEATNRSVGSFSAGSWKLKKIKFREVVSSVPAGGAWVEGNALSVMGTAQMSLHEDFEAEIIASPSVSIVSTGAFRAISLADSSLVTIYKAKITATDNTPGQVAKGRMAGLVSYGSSVCNLRGVNTGDVCLEINGDFNVSVTANGGYINRNTVVMPVVTGTSQGKRYSALNGGRIVTIGGPDYFPGAVAGSVESSSFSWYK